MTWVTVMRAPLRSSFTRAGIGLLLLAVQGCGGVSQLAANATAGFLADAEPAVRAYFDYDTAGAAAATGLLQLEGLHRVSPNNERLTLLLAQAYISYAFGWVMDEQEQAQFEGRYEQADRQKARAYLMYSRAQALTTRLMTARDPRADAVLKGDPDELAAYLRRHYGNPERDSELIFWSAVAWGSAITNAPSLDALVDLPAAKALARHSVSLNEKYEDAGALVLLGGFEASYPEQLGGNWKKGKAYFERALALSGRRSHLHQVNFARTYAINAQDKPLFVSLLREVLSPDDRGPDVRLTNKVARRRAERYLSHIDDFFE